MKNRVLSFIVLMLLLISMVACSGEKTEIDNKNKVVEENIQSNEQNSADLKLFEEFDLLKIEREENSIQNGFVKADFIIQNKSDILTISNFVFEYVVDNGSGTPLNETFRTNEHDGLFVLEPRQKAELGLSEYIGSEINDDMRIFLLSYSYDLSDKNYVIDIVNQNVVISDIKNKSNVSYEEKNIISFDGSDIQAENKCSFVNVGESDIKTLDVSVAIYNEDNVLHSIKNISVVATGEKAIGSNEKGNVRINEIYTRDNGYLVPVYYAYGTGTADQQGYNFLRSI